MVTATTAATMASSSSLLLRPADDPGVGDDNEDDDQDDMSVGLSQLESFLMLNKSRLSAWVEAQKKLVDERFERHQQAALQEQSELDRLHHNLVKIQLEANEQEEGEEGVEGDDDENNNNKKGTRHQPSTRLVREAEQLEADLGRVQRLTSDKETEIRDLDDRLAERQEQVGHEAEWLASIQKSKARAEADLAQCVDKFRGMGLGFDVVVPAMAPTCTSTTTPMTTTTTTTTTTLSALRFAFTLLDPRDPDRRFEFTLVTLAAAAAAAAEEVGQDKDAHEQGGRGGESWYELVDCDPSLGHRQLDLDHLVQGLNKTDDMVPFVCELRQMFVDEIAKEEEEETNDD